MPSRSALGPQGGCPRQVPRLPSQLQGGSPVSEARARGIPAARKVRAHGGLRGYIPSLPPRNTHVTLPPPLTLTRCAPGSELMAAGETVDAMHIVVEGSVGLFVKRGKQEESKRALQRLDLEGMRLRAASSDAFVVGDEHRGS